MAAALTLSAWSEIRGSSCAARQWTRAFDNGDRGRRAAALYATDQRCTLIDWPLSTWTMQASLPRSSNTEPQILPLC